ncbi:prepilin peptidase, partial [Candidatus Margulisiibacteriota bacterium]
RYFLCEVLSVFLFVFCWYKFGASFLFVKTIIFWFCLLILFFTDLDSMVLPNEITVPIIFTGFLFNAWQHQILFSLKGALFGFAVFFLIAKAAKLFYKQEALGGGDIKLITAIGAFWGFKITLFTVYISFLLGGIIGLLLIAFKFKKTKDQLAFGPFIIIGYFLAFEFADKIANFLFG